MAKKGLLVVLSGPSGSGKDTLVEQMQKKDPRICLSISATTRAMRTGEVDTVDYYFMTTGEFENRLSDGEMLEYTHYVGNYYGTPKGELMLRVQKGEIILLVIEVQGAMQVKEYIKDDALLLFIHPPTFEELKARLYARGTESEEKITQRLDKAAQEMKYASRYDYIAINDTVERCADELLVAIQDRLDKNNA